MPSTSCSTSPSLCPPRQDLIPWLVAGPVPGLVASRVPRQGLIPTLVVGRILARLSIRFPTRLQTHLWARLPPRHPRPLRLLCRLLLLSHPRPLSRPCLLCRPHLLRRPCLLSRPRPLCRPRSLCRPRPRSRPRPLSHRLARLSCLRRLLSSTVSLRHVMIAYMGV